LKKKDTTVEVDLAMITPTAIPRSLRRMIKPVVYAYRELTSGMRLLPDFLIIGAQRSGTTFLYNSLISKPEIAPALTKEVHFFDVSFEKGPRWYQAFFPLRLRAALDRGRHRPFLTGEASPYYLFHPLVPARVARVLPDVKLIALLRNPVDRAYSHYQHERRRGFEALSFEQAIEQETARLVGEVEKMLQDHRYNSYNYPHYSYLSRGIYVDQLERWMALFPREQLLIVESEQLYAEPAATVQQVMSFLGIPTPALKPLRQHSAPAYPKLDAAMREHLVEYFKPHNQRLADYLGRRFDWDA
jgi:hypothetical protein